MLNVRNLSVSYGMHRALANANIRVDAGEIVVILGANGAGKSTLLSAISGTSEGQVEGEVVLDGTAISHIQPEKIVEKGIAFVPEGRGIFGDLTVAENLTLGAYTQQARANQVENIAKVYSLFPKLRERQSQTSRTMSGGEQQMVAIGRAMMSAPQILMLDEPSLGLSPLLCKELFANLKNIKESGLGILLVEQNAKQSLAIADRGYLIENGEIEGENSADRMLNDPAVQSAYLGGASSATAVKLQGVEKKSPPVHFITPEGSVPTHSVDATAGIDIGALVGRAEQAAHQPSIFRPTPSSATPPAATAAKSRGNSNHVDPEIENLISNMERSAQSARIVSESTKPLSKKTHQASFDEMEPLPEIPVYRKSTVEVFRRETDGKMHKVEKL